MNQQFQNLRRRLRKRLSPFADLTAGVLVILSSIPLLLIDRPMFFTLIQWSVFALALAANAIVLSRLFFPHVDLSTWVEDARKGSVASAIVVASVAFLLASLFLGLILWARA